MSKARNNADLQAKGASIIPFKAPHANAQPVSLEEKLGAYWVIPESYYEPTDPDWTNAINAALATGRNVYLHERDDGDGWAIHDRLLYASAEAQRLVGDDPGSSYLKVDSGFNMAAAAIIDMRAAADGRYVGADNIGIRCVQPTSATLRSQLIQYPVAIDVSGIFRPRFGGVIQISGAWDGMKATGIGGSGGGGFSAGVLDIGAINLGLDVDGVADFFSVDFIRVWPHGFEPQSGGSASLLAIWGDGQTQGTRWGRCEAIDVTAMSGFQCKHTFQNGEAARPTFGSIGHLKLDGNNSTLFFSAGQVQIGGMYATAEQAECQAIVKTGGVLQIGPHRIVAPAGSTTNRPVTNSSGRLVMLGGSYEAGPTAIPFAEVSGGELTMDTPTFGYGANTARGDGFVKQTGTGVLTLSEPRFQGKGTGSGDAITITTDQAHVVQAHALGAWGVTLPATVANGYYDLDTTFTVAPTVQFATPGDSAFTYTTQVCQYRLSGNMVDYSIVLQFDTNAFTTAAGAFRINPNIPHAPRVQCAAELGELGNVTFTGMVTAEMLTDKTLPLRLNASNAPVSNLGVTNILPSKTGVQVALSGSYIV